MKKLRRTGAVWLLALLVVFGIAGSPCRVHADDGARQPSEAPPVDPPPIEQEQLSLATHWRDGIRFQLESSFFPSADVGGAEVSLIRPLARVRLGMPVNHRARLQLTGVFGASEYDVKDEGELFEDCPACPSPESFNEASLVLLGGYLLNTQAHLFRAGERWALLAAASGRGRAESGAFGDSLTGGGSLGIGYAIPGRLRVGIGARVESKLEGGVSVGPEGHFRWDITERWRLRDRALGLHLRYRPAGRLEYYLEGYRTSDRFLVDSRPSLSSDVVTFQDRRAAVTAGVEWKVWRALRVRSELGAIVDRRLSFEADGDRLDAVSGDPSAYMSLKLELRP